MFVQIVLQQTYKSNPSTPNLKVHPGINQFLLVSLVKKWWNRFRGSKYFSYFFADGYPQVIAMFERSNLFRLIIKMLGILWYNNYTTYDILIFLSWTTWRNPWINISTILCIYLIICAFFISPIWDIQQYPRLPWLQVHCLQTLGNLDDSNGKSGRDQTFQVPKLEVFT